MAVGDVLPLAPGRCARAGRGDRAIDARAGGSRARRRPRRSAATSRGSCTTSSPTPSASWSSRPARRGRCCGRLAGPGRGRRCSRSKSTGREAMTELRRFLGCAGDETRRAVWPRSRASAQLDDAGRARPPGRAPGALEVDGEPRPLPASLDVTVYRIVQEALTNALRYARRRRTLVRLTLEDGPAPGRGPRRRAGGQQRRMGPVGDCRGCASEPRLSAVVSRPVPGSAAATRSGRGCRSWRPARAEEPRA